MRQKTLLATPAAALALAAAALAEPAAARTAGGTLAIRTCQK